MLVPSQDGSEEGGAGGEDHFVSGELLLALACQRHVEEILIVPDLSEGNTDVSLKVIPLQTELFRAHYEGKSAVFLSANMNHCNFISLTFYNSPTVLCLWFQLNNTVNLAAVLS